MHLYVTGATGFVGRSVVAAAVARGHRVTALVRNGTDPGVLGDAIESGLVDLVRGDLSRSAPLVEGLRGVDVLLHLAAVKGGDYFARFAGTVIGTENLLTAAAEAGVTNLAAVSTFSVYDYSSRPTNAALDEDTPVITDVSDADDYAETKLYQDELYRGFAAGEGRRMVMLRPGMIYGRGELWHPLLGGELGPLMVRIGGSARPPITYVENTADALVLACEKLVDDPDSVDGEIINIVDDDLPTQNEYITMLVDARNDGADIDIPRALSVPFTVMKAAAVSAQWISKRFFDGRVKLPSIAVPAQLDARFKPFGYPNAKAKRLLGWTPRYSTVEAIRRSSTRG